METQLLRYFSSIHLDKTGERTIVTNISRKVETMPPMKQGPRYFSLLDAHSRRATERVMRSGCVFRRRLGSEKQVSETTDGVLFSEILRSSKFCDAICD